MRKNESLYNLNLIFLKNLSLLREYEMSIIKDPNINVSLIKRILLVCVIPILCELKRVSSDGLGFYTEEGIIDFEKFKIYFELAIELNEKILIPRNISIEEYFKEKMETCAE